MYSRGVDTRARARLDVLLAAVLFSTGGVVIKACSMTGWQVASLRSGIAAATLLLVLPATRRGWSRRTWLVAVAYAATLCLYVQANKLTTAVNAIFLQSTAPLYLLLISPLLLRERVRPRELVTMLALGLGLALFLAGGERPQPTAPDPDFGNVLAAVSGLTWALTVAGLRWLARSEGQRGGSPAGAAASAAAAGNVLVFLVCLPWALPLSDTTPGDWLGVAWLGAFQIALAYVFLTRGVRRVPALAGALLLLLEPVLNSLWTWAVHGEVPGPWSGLGALTILLATAAYAVANTRRDRSLPQGGAP
ncbi:MAG: DMT family transporter [Planctomycetota bacterium]